MNFIHVFSIHRKEGLRPFSVKLSAYQELIKGGLCPHSENQRGGVRPFAPPQLRLCPPSTSIWWLVNIEFFFCKTVLRGLKNDNPKDYFEKLFFTLLTLFFHYFRSKNKVVFQGRPENKKLPFGLK